MPLIIPCMSTFSSYKCVCISLNILLAYKYICQYKCKDDETCFYLIIKYNYFLTKIRGNRNRFRILSAAFFKFNNQKFQH